MDFKESVAIRSLVQMVKTNHVHKLMKNNSKGITSGTKRNSLWATLLPNGRITSFSPFDHDEITFKFTLFESYAGITLNDPHRAVNSLFKTTHMVVQYKWY